MISRRARARLPALEERMADLYRAYLAHHLDHLQTALDELGMPCDPTPDPTTDPPLRRGVPPC